MPVSCTARIRIRRRRCELAEQLVELVAVDHTRAAHQPARIHQVPRAPFMHDHLRVREHSGDIARTTRVVEVDMGDHDGREFGRPDTEGRERVADDRRGRPGARFDKAGPAADEIAAVMPSYPAIRVSIWKTSCPSSVIAGGRPPVGMAGWPGLGEACGPSRRPGERAASLLMCPSSQTRPDASGPRGARTFRTAGLPKLTDAQNQCRSCRMLDGTVCGQGPLPVVTVIARRGRARPQRRLRPGPGRLLARTGEACNGIVIQSLLCNFLFCDMMNFS